jgi:hypothetical protein
MNRTNMVRSRRCPHCQARAVPTNCEQCKRPMCEECLGNNGLCGLCNDEAEKQDANIRNATYSKTA